MGSKDASEEATNKVGLDNVNVQSFLRLSKHLVCIEGLLSPALACCTHSDCDRLVSHMVEMNREMTQRHQ